MNALALLVECKYHYIMETQGLRTTQRLAAALKDARLRAGLTQLELAGLAGVSRRWLVDFEAGRSPRSELHMVLSTIAALGLELRLTPATDESGSAAQAARSILKGLE